MQQSQNTLENLVMRQKKDLRLRPLHLPQRLSLVISLWPRKWDLRLEFSFSQKIFSFTQEACFTKTPRYVFYFSAYSLNAVDLVFDSSYTYINLRLIYIYAHIPPYTHIHVCMYLCPDMQVLGLHMSAWPLYTYMHTVVYVFI